MRAARELQRGLTQSQVAAMLGTTNASVSNWAMRFRLGGFDELRARRPGRPPRSQVKMNRIGAIRQSVLTRYPDELGLAAFLWNWRTIQALSFRSARVEVSRWTVARYLREWGLQPPLSVVELAASWGHNTSAPRSDPIAKRAFSGSPFFVAAAEIEEAAASNARGASRRIVLWAVGRRGETAFAAFAAPLQPKHVIDFLRRLRRECDTPFLTVVADMPCSAPPILDWIQRQGRSIRLHTVNFKPSAAYGAHSNEEKAYES
jgi:transposase